MPRPREHGWEPPERQRPWAVWLTPVADNALRPSGGRGSGLNGRLLMDAAARRENKRRRFHQHPP